MLDRKGILKHPPLTYVLASVRFAPWPLMAKRIDEIQDDLREITPLMHRIHIQKVGVDGQVVNQEDGESLSAWMLMPSDRSYVIRLSPDQMLIFCKKYTTFTKFEDIFNKTIDVIVKHMRFIDVISMGMRYVDHIKVREGEILKDYINNSFLPADISGIEKLGGVIGVIYKSKTAELRVSSTSLPNELSTPHDIIDVLAMMQEPNSPLKIERLTDGEMLLDIDSIKSNVMPERMEKNEILNQLKLLHQEANIFFRHESVFTEYAFKVWKGEV